MVAAVPLVSALGGALASAAPFIAAIGTGYSIYSQMQAGAMQKGYYQAQARQHELEMKQADLQSKQISALRLQELNANLGAIEAARAGKNLLGDSPTETALVRSFTRESLGARSNEVLDSRLRYLGAMNARQAALQQGKASQQAAMIGAIGEVPDFVMRMGRLLPRRPKPKAGAG